MIGRQQVLEKYNNRCAYCGHDLTLKTMQVDHKQSKHTGGTDNIDNLMPSCRLCNHYKRAQSIEAFRVCVQGMLRKLEKIYIFKVAQKYDMINWRGWDGRFYFEYFEDGRAK